MITMITLPLLLTLVLGTATCVYLVNESNRPFKACLTQLYQAQQNLIPLVNNLLNFNKTIRKKLKAYLNAKKRLLQVTKVGNPYAIAAAAAYVATQLAHLMAAKAQQTILIEGINMYRRAEQLKVKMYFGRMLSARHSKVSKIPMPVEKTSPWSPFSEYQLVLELPKNQAAQVSWQFNASSALFNSRILGEYFARILSPFISSNNEYKVPQFCQVTLTENKGLLWKAQIYSF